jgi:beta-lactamase regulating signal transducer with metallopeptidase domain
MMASEALLLLARLNLVASAAIAIVLALRPFVRRRLGAHQAYQLWLTVPLALLGAILPAMEGAGPVGPLEHAIGDADTWLAAGTRCEVIFGVWGIGVLVAMGVAAGRYAWFLSRVRSGLAGPAVVGIVAPRLVTPADFADRFTPEERRLVRAHERAHMDRLDPRCNALVLVLQCLNWFNPLVHLAASAMRFDQELACDATVMTRLPTERRRYAETLLHSQHGGAVSPLGCGWSGAGARLLVTRLTTLMQRRPDAERCDLADLMLAALWTLVLVAAWSAQAPDRGPWAVYIVLAN